MLKRRHLAIGLIAAIAAAPAAAEEKLVFVTESPGGSWFPAGGAIKAAVEELFDGISVQVRPGGGLANIEAVSKGLAQLGMSNSISAVANMDGPVQSVGFGTHVIAGCEVEEETVYKVTKAIYERLSDLGVAVSALRSTTPDMLSQDVGIPQHPGAARFFKEVNAN